MSVIVVLGVWLSSANPYAVRSDCLAEHVDAVHRYDKLCGPLTLCFCLRSLGYRVENSTIVDGANVSAQGMSVLEQPPMGDSNRANGC